MRFVSFLLLLISILLYHYYSTYYSDDMGNETLPILIIGGGLAGLSATVEAATLEPSVKVILVDKEANIGGNSAKATSGINAMTEPGDSLDAFERDTLASGGGLSNPDLVHKLVHESEEALAWLKLQDPTLDLGVVSQCGGHTHPRTHRCPPAPDGRPVPVGFRTITALKDRIAQLSNVQVWTSTRVANIYPEEKRVRLVKEGETLDLDVSAVVLTSGGFAGQTQELQQPEGTKTLLSEYAPQLLNTATTNGPWANGDGVRLGLAAGAATKDMEHIQVHPSGFVDPNNPNSGSKFLAPEALRAYGAVMLNADGHRFADELSRRDVLTKSIFEANSRGRGHLPPDYASCYLVLTEPMIEQFGKATASFYAKKGLFVQCNGLDEVAAYIQVDPTQLKDEFTRYDMHVVERKNDTSVKAAPDAFGKTVFPNPITSDGTYWVGIITPCVHYTMGGLAINSEAAVMSSKTNNPIPGLFAAGEVTSGVHGRNRLAGNSLLECVVYGRTAGRSASLYASEN
ncbi:FAD binding domain-containing protein [Zychaea mexicana]|uniref:FAD binding domain-containing protein n=1 Tax=Zychaea mexicana TaxID=64656 RepID=UPI0022FE5FFE|nr:FAD binding domain-containing protein [Zychaea mexicana]KAI9492057.1 FAD binding domain-containing protein [Zychaea mexicana]